MDDLPLGPGGAAQIEELPAQPIDLLKQLASGASHQVLLQILQPLSQSFQDGKGSVHERVDQGVGQVVGSGLPDAPFPFANSLSDRLERISGRLLKRYDPTDSEEQADLLSLHGFVETQLLHHDEAV